MSSHRRLLALALVFAALISFPLLAADQEEALPPTDAEQASGSESPAQDLPEATNPGDELKFEAIRICEDTEELQCPSVCACVVISNTIRCLGSDPVCTG